MKKPAPRQRGPKNDNKRPAKKKPSVLALEKIEYIDYKDVETLQRFMSDRSKIRSRRVANTTVQQQRELATAIKNAREMALLPYTKRVANVRPARPPRDSDAASVNDEAVDANDDNDDDDAAGDDGED